MNARITCVATAILLATGFEARAAVLLDYSPAAAPGATIILAYNQYQGQHFYQPVSFTVDTTVTGMAIYASTDAYVGEPVLIDVYSNNANDQPGFSVRSMQVTIAAIDSPGSANNRSYVRAYASFPTPVTMDADQTLWFSMSGNMNSPGQVVYSDLNSPFGKRLWKWSGTAWSPGGSDVAMQLYGTNSLTPEPGSLVTLALAGGGLLVRNRRRS